MIRTVYMDRDIAEQYKQRVQALQPDARRRWGSMSVGQMLAHLDEFLRFSIGEAEARDDSNWFFRYVFGPVAFHLLPFPRGVLPAPANTTPEGNGDLDHQKQAVLDHIDRFVELYERNPDHRAVNPMLGPLTMKQWALVHGRHFPHHLKQFGV